MTAITGFKSDNVPALIGDFLLTNEHTSQKYLIKKICRIANNFAIAWAGNLCVAKNLIDKLNQSFVNKHISYSEIKELFTKKRIDEYGTLSMVVAS